MLRAFGMRCNNWRGVLHAMADLRHRMLFEMRRILCLVEGGLNLLLNCSVESNKFVVRIGFVECSTGGINEGTAVISRIRLNWVHPISLLLAKNKL